MMLNHKSKVPVRRQTSRRPVLTGLKIFPALCLMLLAASPGVGQQRTVSIQGQVHTSDGTPLPNDVTVRLETAEGVSSTQQLVGMNGKFEFNNLKGDLFRLVVTAKGFKSATQDVDMHYYASRYPNIYLSRPDTKESAAPSSPTVSATDLAAPKNARKEYEKGHVSLEAGNYDDARKHLERAIADDPCYARAHASLGVALSMQHQFAPAESALKKSIECDAGFLEAYIELAILFNVEGKYAENEASLKEGLSRFPNEWQLHYQLGVTERGIGQLKKAEAAYLKAQSINPAVPAEFHVKLADVLLREKKYDKAYAEMQAYLRAVPNGSFAGETKALMNRLETSGLVTAVPDRAAKANPPPQ
jgi:tetratricopeptide (TPR) repeat protein